MRDSVFTGQEAKIIVPCLHFVSLFCGKIKIPPFSPISNVRLYERHNSFRILVLNGFCRKNENKSRESDRIGDAKKKWSWSHRRFWGPKNDTRRDRGASETLEKLRHFSHLNLSLGKFDQLYFSGLKTGKWRRAKFREAKDDVYSNKSR